MSRPFAVALNTFREAVRDRVLLGVLLAATAVLLFALALAELSYDAQARVVFDVGFASVSLFSVIVAIFLGSSLLAKEVERKTLYVILPKPIGRGEFLVGKYLGIVLTAAVFVALMGAVQLWVSALQAQATPLVVASPLVLAAGAAAAARLSRDRTALLLPGSVAALLGAAAVASATGVPLSPALGRLALALGEVTVVAAVALFFSSFSTPFLTGALSVGVWLVGRSADQMATMESRLLAEELRALLRGLAYVVPNLHLYSPSRAALESPGPWTYVAQSVGYGALYAVVLVALAVVVFRRRDLG
jgi:ABC-type transport system involved in multi-copper enzyme maturation permease subunit